VRKWVDSVNNNTTTAPNSNNNKKSENESIRATNKVRRGVKVYVCVYMHIRFYDNTRTRGSDSPPLNGKHPKERSVEGEERI
jgi:hypothetical protein